MSLGLDLKNHHSFPLLIWPVSVQPASVLIGFEMLTSVFLCQLIDCIPLFFESFEISNAILLVTNQNINRLFKGHTQIHLWSCPYTNLDIETLPLVMVTSEPGRTDVTAGVMPCDLSFDELECTNFMVKLTDLTKQGVQKRQGWLQCLRYEPQILCQRKKRKLLFVKVTWHRDGGARGWGEL